MELQSVPADGRTRAPAAPPTRRPLSSASSISREYAIARRRGEKEHGEAGKDLGMEPPPPASHFKRLEGNDAPALRFEILHRSRKEGSFARVGLLHTAHGTVQTPGFVPVATNGALKCADLRRADAAGAELVFSNAYHLLLSPGPEVIERAGGLHAFAGRAKGKSFITDSGGFQIFSMLAGAAAADLRGERREWVSRLRAKQEKERKLRTLTEY